MFPSQISPWLPGAREEVDGRSDGAGAHGCIGHQEAAGGWRAKQTVTGNDSRTAHILTSSVAGYLAFVKAVAFGGWLTVDHRGLMQYKCLFGKSLI